MKADKLPHRKESKHKIPLHKESRQNFHDIKNQDKHHFLDLKNHSTQNLPTYRIKVDNLSPPKKIKTKFSYINNQNTQNFLHM